MLLNMKNELLKGACCYKSMVFILIYYG